MELEIPLRLRNSLESAAHFKFIHSRIANLPQLPVVESLYRQQCDYYCQCEVVVPVQF